MSVVRRLSGTGAFTLIEMLVVMVVLGALSAIALPSFLGQNNKAYDIAVKSDLASAYRAASAQRAELNNSFPEGQELITSLKHSEPQLRLVDSSDPAPGEIGVCGESDATVLALVGASLSGRTFKLTAPIDGSYQIGDGVCDVPNAGSAPDEDDGHDEEADNPSGSSGRLTLVATYPVELSGAFADIDVGPQGVYLGDHDALAIRRYSTAGQQIGLFGTPGASVPPWNFTWLRGSAADPIDGSLWVSNLTSPTGGELLHIAPDGSVLKRIDVSDNLPAVPFAVNNDHEVYLLASHINDYAMGPAKIIRMRADGTVLDEFGDPQDDLVLDGAALLPNGGVIAMTSSCYMPPSCTLRRYNAAGSHLEAITIPTFGPAVIFGSDPSGAVYLVEIDVFGSREITVHKLDADGELAASWVNLDQLDGDPLNVAGIAVAPDGDVWALVNSAPPGDIDPGGWSLIRFAQ